MFFRKNKLLAVLTILSGVLGYDTALAELSKNDPVNNTQKTEKPGTKIVRREANKNINNNKHIKNLEFHRSLNGGAVFEVLFEENVGSFSDYKTKLSQDGYTLTITFDNTSISDRWVSNIDTKVFNTIVDSIRVHKENNKVILRVC